MNKRLLILSCLVLVLSGCGTVESWYQDRFGIFSGVRMDFEWISNADRVGMAGVVGWFDLPVSLLADTVLLPFSITWGFTYGWR